MAARRALGARQQPRRRPRGRHEQRPGDRGARRAQTALHHPQPHAERGPAHGRGGALVLRALGRLRGAGGGRDRRGDAGAGAGARRAREVRRRPHRRTAPQLRRLPGDGRAAGAAPVTPSRPAAQQIVLVGLSGVGKSTVGRALAERLGWPLIDTDDAVTRREGKTPAQLITERGETAFRQLEERAVAEAVRTAPAVIATGGGAFMSARSRRALGERGLICYLDATPGEIARRVQGAPDAQERPLLGRELQSRLYELDDERRPFYNHADLWVPVQERAGAAGAVPEAAVARIVRAWVTDGPRLVSQPSRLERLGDAAPARVPAAIVDTGEERCPIWIGAGELERLPERLRMLGLGGTVFLISDSTVMEAHGQRVARALAAAGIAGASYIVPPGESSKSLRVAGELYTWLAERRAERSDLVLAFGGGVVGDLAGYVAASYLRGMPLVQLPTTVLAMNDAAIGGKVAVDLPAGKNLVGAFHQPRAVIADISTLRTLPRRAYLEGFAEVIKHALILDPPLLGELERHVARLTADDPDPELLACVTARSARLKALIVSSDPYEHGLRAILNYGHTVGHALETAGAYRHHLHGEAVAVGMMAAARIAERMGLIDEALVQRHSEVLRAYGLPLAASGVRPEAVLAAMRLDKKVQAGRQRFVLLDDAGRATVRDDVPAALVEDVVRGLIEP
ncbi:MAG: 3-dehydroquinate synthase [Dehalococcoidia bacterium]|nr:3-dehydroquinate synthase [Dehalococcoidia bacterium]